MKKGQATKMKSVSSGIHELLSKKAVGYQFTTASLFSESGARSYTAVTSFITKMKVAGAIKIVPTNNTDGDKRASTYEIVDPKALVSRKMWTPRDFRRKVSTVVETQESAQVVETTLATSNVLQRLPGMTDGDYVRHLMNTAIDCMASAEKVLRTIDSQKSIKNATVQELMAELQERLK